MDDYFPIIDENINPCRGCPDYEENGCKSSGGCGRPQVNIDAVNQWIYSDTDKIVSSGKNMLTHTMMEYYNTEIVHLIREDIKILRQYFDKMASDSTEALYASVNMNRYLHDPYVFAEAFTKIPVIDHYVYIAEILHDFELNIDNYIDAIYHTFYTNDSEEQ